MHLRSSNYCKENKVKASRFMACQIWHTNTSFKSILLEAKPYPNYSNGDLSWTNQDFIGNAYSFS